MRYAIPVKDLLLLLCPNAVVFIQEIKKGALGLLQRRVGSRLEISKIGENTLFELLGILHWATESLESERQTSDNIRSGNMKEVAPTTSQPRLSRAINYQSHAPEHT